MMNNKCNIYIMKVKSHEGTLCNEIADTAAKQALTETFTNIINKTEEVSRYECQNGICINSIKKEIKKLNKLRLKIRWYYYINKKERTLIKNQKLCNITQIHYIKHELKHLSHYNWSILSKLRS